MVRMAVSTQAPRKSAGEFVPRRCRIDDEDAGTDHRAGNEGRRAEKAEALHQPGALADVSEQNGVEFWSVTWRKLYRFCANVFFFSECVNSGHFVQIQSISRST